MAGVFCMTAPVGAVMISVIRANKIKVVITPMMAFVLGCVCLTLDVKDILHINFTFDIFISFISFTLLWFLKTEIGKQRRRL